jgi:hypothetical protein
LSKGKASTKTSSFWGCGPKYFLQLLSGCYGLRVRYGLPSLPLALSLCQSSPAHPAAIQQRIILHRCLVGDNTNKGCARDIVFCMGILLVKTPTRAVVVLLFFGLMRLLLVKTPTRAVLLYCFLHVSLVGENTNKGCARVFVLYMGILLVKTPTRAVVLPSCFLHLIYFILKSCHPVPKQITIL